MRTLRKSFQHLLTAAAILAVSAFSGATVAQQLTVVGAGPGAGAYQLAGAFSENINRLDLGITVTNRASQGFVANTRMVETGGTDFALTNGIFVYSSQHGQEPFTEMKATNIRGIGPVTTAWYQMAVPKNSGIESYMDLKGKRVNYAEKGSNTEHMTTVIFDTLGISDGIDKEYMRWDQAATAMADGNIAAFGIPNPVPSPSILQASAATPVRILSVPDEVIKHFTDSNPGYYRDTVPAGSYTGMEEESFETVAYTAFVVANASVDEEVVYKATKATYDEASRDFIVTAMGAWRIGLDAAKEVGFLDQMKAFGLEIHPGAARYWKERGLMN
jgi:hypothetical protein